MSDRLYITIRFLVLFFGIVSLFSWETRSFFSIQMWTLLQKIGTKTINEKGENVTISEEQFNTFFKSHPEEARLFDALIHK